MKLIAKIVIIIVVFCAGFYFGTQNVIAPSNGSNQSVDQVQQDQSIQVGLMIDFGNGQIRTFNNIEVAKDFSVFNLLEEVAGQNDLEIESKDYGEAGAFLEAIGDIKNDLKNDKFWQFWVNNNYSEVGASNYKLENGDIVEWKFIKGQIN